MLVDRADGPAGGVGERPRGEDGEGGLLHVERGPEGVHEDEVALALVHVEDLLLPRPRDVRDQVLRLLPPAVLFRAPVCHARDFRVEHPLVDERLLRVKVFVKGCSNNRVVVNADAVLLEQVVQVGASSGG